MFTVRSRNFHLLITFISLALLVIPACATEQSRPRTVSNSDSNNSGDLIGKINETHATITQQVNKKKLPAVAGKKANELKLELKKYLIQTEAQMQILELEILQGADDKRKAALEKMMLLSAEQERVKLDFLQRLESLMVQSRTAKTGSNRSDMQKPVDSSKKEKEAKETGTKWKTETLDIEIEIAPEDISE